MTPPPVPPLQIETSSHSQSVQIATAERLIPETRERRVKEQTAGAQERRVVRWAADPDVAVRG